MVKLNMKSAFKKILYFLLERKIRNNAIVNGRIIINRDSKIIHLNNSIKNNVIFNNNVMFLGKINISNKGKIVIGENTSIRKNCILNCANRIIIGDNVIFADNVIVSDTNHHPVNPEDRLIMIQSGWSTKLWSWDYADSNEVKIGNNVWIGQYSRILKGVVIGDNAIVASNSVVTKDVPANAIAAGNPAKIVKTNIDKENRFFENSFQP